MSKVNKIVICLFVAMAVVAAYMVTPASAEDHKKGNWTDYAVHNMGEPVNSDGSEGEQAEADDGTLVYCSSRQDLAVAPGDPKDLYLGYFDKETGTWAIENMGIPVNAPPATDVHPLRKGDDREPWIMPDGNTIYFKSDRSAGDGNVNDIFVTHKVDGVWQEPELVGYPVSTDEGNEHCPVLQEFADGVSRLCFSSARAGGYGGYDLWCSEPDGAGGWQYPVNQGPNINTDAPEYHFVLSKDKKYVFFSSGRPGGYGGMDTYAARWLGPNIWGPAINLGTKVNTPTTDICPHLSPDGEVFHWFSYRQDDTHGSSDIYWADYNNIKRVIKAAEGDDDGHDHH